MPRWNPFTERGRTGGIVYDERRTMEPGYQRMRAGGRAGWTLFRKVDPKSRKAIQSTWSSFSRETTAHREVFFRHIFKNLTNAQLRSLRRRGVTQDELVTRLATADHNYLQRLLSHNKVVEGTKVAADRFFLKNVSGVLAKATRERQGLFYFRPGSSRDDIATGILAAIEQYGLPGEHGAPTRGGRRRRGGGRQREVLPDVSEPEEMPDVSEPSVSTQVSEPEGVVPGVSETEEGSGAVPGEATGQPGIDINSLLAQALQPKPIKIASLVHKGLRHHGPSKPFFLRADEAHARKEVSSLLEQASQYAVHLMSTGLRKTDVMKLANHALKAESLGDFHDRVAKVVSQSTRGSSPSIVADYEVPYNVRLFDDDGNEVHHVSISNLNNLWAGRTSDNSVPLTVEQQQAAAFHLVATLAKHGGSKTAATHLKRFLLHVNDSTKDAVQNYYNLHYTPRRLSQRDQLRLLAQVILHGNASPNAPVPGYSP